MQELNDIIELQTNEPTKKLSFVARYLVQINFTFDLTVHSNSFAGTARFCVRKDEIETLCNDLINIHSSLSGTVKISDNDSDGFVEFVIQHNGHLIVSGRVGGTHEDHFMIFKFSTDQTCIPQFVSDLQSLIKYKDE